MRRGEVYRVRRPGRGDPRRSRPFVVVSREALLQTGFTTVICAPIFSNYDGLETQVRIGPAAGLRADSTVYCDNLTSVPRGYLTDYLGLLSDLELAELDRALTIALGLDRFLDQ